MVLSAVDSPASPSVFSSAMAGMGPAAVERAGWAPMAMLTAWLAWKGENTKEQALKARLSEMVKQ